MTIPKPDPETDAPCSGKQNKNKLGLKERHAQGNGPTPDSEHPPLTRPPQCQVKRPSFYLISAHLLPSSGDAALVFFSPEAPAASPPTPGFAASSSLPGVFIRLLVRFMGGRRSQMLPVIGDVPESAVFSAGFPSAEELFPWQEPFPWNPQTRCFRLYQGEASFPALFWDAKATLSPCRTWPEEHPTLRFRTYLRLPWYR